MKNKLPFYVAIALTVGFLGGYLITQRTQNQQQNNNQTSLLNNGNGTKQDQLNPMQMA